MPNSCKHDWVVVWEEAMGVMYVCLKCNKFRSDDLKD